MCLRVGDELWSGSGVVVGFSSCLSASSHVLFEVLGVGLGFSCVGVNVGASLFFIMSSRSFNQAFLLLLCDCLGVVFVTWNPTNVAFVS